MAIRVLFMDDIHTYMPEQVKGERLVFVEAELFSLDVYEVHEIALVEAADLTATGKVDVVVIGNNLGAGVAKAKSIAAAMRAKTVVVWNDYRPGDEKPYADLGFARFGSRNDAAALIESVLFLH